MKLKSVLCACAVFITFAFATTAYASNEKINIGTPIDLATGAEVTTFKAGQHIIVPVDVSNDENKAYAYSLKITYDTGYLSGGITGSDLASNQTEFNNIKTYLDSNASNLKTDATDSSVYGYINRIGSTGLFGTTYVGSYECGVKDTTSGTTTFSVGWAHSSAADLNANAPEGYALFTVLKDVPVDSLNFELYGVLDSVTTVCDTNNNDVKTINSADKANACEGAFQVKIDSSKLTYWIQELYASIDGKEKVQLTEYVNEAGTTVYAFPTRVTTNSGNATTATVTITATTSSDQDGTQNVTNDVQLGQLTINLDQPTAYTDSQIN